jgi:hypothetical protein
MDPADIDSIRGALAAQGALVAEHSNALREAMEAFKSLATRVTQMGAQLDLLVPPATLPPLPVAPPPDPTLSAHLPRAREPLIPAPERYAGDMGTCRAFLIQCSLVFSQQPLSYPSEKAKIAFVIGSLKGNALAWASALWESDSPVIENFGLFVAEMRKVFDHPVEGGDVAKRLISLRQSSRSVAEFSVEFRTYAARSGWNDKSLHGLFVSGLCESIKDELATREEADTLDELISLSIRLDNRLRERCRERTGSSVPPALAASRFPHLPRAALPAPVTRAVTEEEPMQLGRTRLTQAERLHRIRTGVCLYCALPGHLISTCPSLPKDRAQQ